MFVIKKLSRSTLNSSIMAQLRCLGLKYIKRVYLEILLNGYIFIIILIKKY